MNLDETQEIKDLETSSSGTLVFNENKTAETNLDNQTNETSNTEESSESKSPSIIKNLKKMIVNKDKVESEQPAVMSNYCLRLNTQNQLKHILDGPVTILPLFVGLNSIGRSNENTVCIINKNLSKKHACIQLTQKENGELEECLVWDLGSLNKTKTIDRNEGLIKDEKYSLGLSKFVQFGVIRFDLVKMTESQFKEQELKPVKLVELDDNLFDYSAKKMSKSSTATNGSSKLAKVVEIPNTLDDTYLVENNDVKKEEKNGKNEIFVSDTEPEDNEDEDQNTTDFHLEMSASIINQSTYSTNQTRTSFVIPDTLASQEVDEKCVEVNGKQEEATTTNGKSDSEKNGSVNNDKSTTSVVTTSTESTMVTVVSETIIISDTQPVVSQEETKSSENSNVTSQESESKASETPKAEESKVEIESVEKCEEKKEETIERELPQEKKVELNGEKTEETTTKQKEETSKPVVDESITISDDDDDEVQEIKKDEVKPVVEEVNIPVEEQPKEEAKPTESEETQDKKDKEVIIESTLLDNGDEKGGNVSTVSIVALDETDKREEINEKSTVVDETTEETSKTSKRGRKSKASTIKPSEIEETASTENANETNNTTTSEAPERPSRRSTRVSIAPVVPTPVVTTKPTRGGRNKKAADNVEPVDDKVQETEEKAKEEPLKSEVIEETKEESKIETIEQTKEESKEEPREETILETKEVVKEEKSKRGAKKETKKAEEPIAVEEQAKAEDTPKEEEPKLGRRSSLRIRSNVQNSSSLAREKLLKQQAESKSKAAANVSVEVESSTASKRKKSIEPASAAKANKKLKNLENEESYHADEEEETEKSEPVVDETKSKGRGRRAKATAEPIEEEKEEEEKNDEPPTKTKRTYNRRKTIAVDSGDLKEAATLTKKTKANTNTSHVDTYLYEESSENDQEQEEEKKQGKNKKGKGNLSLVESATAETKGDTKKRKGKANETAKSKEDEHSEPEAPKRGRKRKSNDPKTTSVAQDAEDKQGATPKLFFHSKNRTKTASSDTPSKSDGAESNGLSGGTTAVVKKNNVSMNKPTYSSALNSSKINDTSLNTSVSLSPSKKFKLLKTKSSSSENLNNTITSSDDDTGKQDVETAIAKKKTNSNKSAKSPVAISNNNNKKNVSFSEPAKETASETKKEEQEAKEEAKETEPTVVELEESLEETTSGKGNKKQARLNVTLKEKPAKPARESAKSRLSLQPTSTSAPTRQTSRNLKGPNVVKIMTTGIRLSEKQQKIVSDLGGQIVTDVKECTHLITNKILKSYKFLSCLNRSTFILNERWIDECNKNKMFSNMATFSLKDAQFEKQHKFTLQTSLTKSKSHQLFKDWKFVIKCRDDDPEMTVDNLKIIIECGGGEVCDGLPSNEEELDQYCVLYDDMEAVKHDKTESSEKVTKILLDNFLNCILKQSFESSSFVQLNESD